MNKRTRKKKASINSIRVKSWTSAHTVARRVQKALNRLPYKYEGIIATRMVQAGSEIHVDLKFTPTQSIDYFTVNLDDYTI